MNLARLWGVVRSGLHISLLMPIFSTFSHIGLRFIAIFQKLIGGNMAVFLALNSGAPLRFHLFDVFAPGPLQTRNGRFGCPTVPYTFMLLTVAHFGTL